MYHNLKKIFILIRIKSLNWLKEIILILIIMRFFSLFIPFLTSVYAGYEKTCNEITPQNNCVSFSVGSGTGCAWMCQYCEDQLGTTNYYFTDGVCSYESGGCVGNPQVGVTYTCCSN